MTARKSVFQGRCTKEELTLWHLLAKSKGKPLTTMIRDGLNIAVKDAINNDSIICHCSPGLPICDVCKTKYNQNTSIIYTKLPTRENQQPPQEPTPDHPGSHEN